MNLSMQIISINRNTHMNITHTTEIQSRYREINRQADRQTEKERKRKWEREKRERLTDRQTERKIERIFICLYVNIDA